MMIEVKGRDKVVQRGQSAVLCGQNPRERVTRRFRVTTVPPCLPRLSSSYSLYIHAVHAYDTPLKPD